MIFYFSGTGNSAWTARQIAGVTGEELSSLAVTDGTIEASPAVYENRVVIGTRGQSIRGLVLK